jgi:hypothetical protein
MMLRNKINLALIFIILTFSSCEVQCRFMYQDANSLKQVNTAEDQLTTVEKLDEP